ncbi:epoxyqueuosine reductase [Dehalogenimonas formicexedens]|uniref:Epoxyqueuosine reductase n=1 Tax=Dehalogenimonas formicexedens TaxID=1839801 RepID=A0A1P8F6R9_9CHLR|nr:4Fe-4S double cluster binding domain-containing protein [Dehalogenimonas formicexedens]APV44174.1 epoxyqueuosine reductase [Dehalogenimonas formicexedens]
MTPSTEVINNLAEAGYRACIAPIERLADLEAEYKMITARDVWRRSPHLSQHRFDFAPPIDFPARSIIVIAAPVTPVRLGFIYRGIHHSFEAPPLSGDYDRVVARIIKIITDAIGTHGYRLADSNLPTKVLASHTGLLQNGINNMGYIEGMGSFFRLTSFFSDLPAVDDTWGEQHRVAPSCRECGLCIEACPTQCISQEVYDVSRCLSLLSKEPSDFPDWVKKRWHNSLIGCRVCQQVCPMNHDVINSAANVAEFSEAETLAILSGVDLDKLNQSTRDKLRYFHLAPFYSILPRNLRLLLEKSGEPA